jgi:probable H4MPT-linked C1 transfer pathway protein
VTWLGLDIGGANLKASDGDRFARSQPFALWRDPARLPQELRALLAAAPAADRLAVTMTGELADCFASKAQGVRFIVDAVREAAGERAVFIYLTDGRLVSPELALRRPLLAAASNWHALARFVGRYAARGPALLLDVGSTTCDIIPLVDGIPAACGRNDTERLLAGELVYTGVERSPVCAVAAVVPYRGQQCPVAQELFATARDVYITLGQLPEDAGCRDTADGQPATRLAARRRLARMIAADVRQFSQRDALVLAAAVAEAQTRQLAAAIRQVADRLAAWPSTVILSGHGDFLAQRALLHLGQRRRPLSLQDQLGPQQSRCAPACALAVLARELSDAGKSHP